MPLDYPALVHSKALYLQGSVGTRLRCGGIFNDVVAANLLLSITIKEFCKLWCKTSYQPPGSFAFHTTLTQLLPTFSDIKNLVQFSSLRIFHIVNVNWTV